MLLRVTARYASYATNARNLKAGESQKIEVEDWVLLTQADQTAYVAAVRSRNLMQMRQAAFHASDSAKLERLCDVVEEAQQAGLKVVVYSYFLHILSRAQEALGHAARRHRERGH